MTDQSVLRRVLQGRHFITFNRPAQQNSFTVEQLEIVLAALDDAERDPECRMVVFEGQHGNFCRGLDFQDGLARAPTGSSAVYVDVLERISRMSAFVVAHVDGQVLAGGLGFVAASDYAVATPNSTFSLPEANWGLVPACVGLFLQRRIGVHRTMRMSLTTETLDAEAARSCGLLDEIDAEPERALRRLWLKIARLEPRTIARIKRYFLELPDSPTISPAQRAAALAESDAQMNDPEIRAGISAWIAHARFPWERRDPPR
jgi:polyketide biosynthesis enoyl-CoA hydratase PksH